MKNFLVILVLILAGTCVYLWLRCPAQMSLNDAEWEKKDSINLAVIDSLSAALEDDSIRTQIISDFIAENKQLKRTLKQLRNEIEYQKLGDVLSVDDSIVAMQIPHIARRINSGIESRYDTTGFNLPSTNQLRDSIDRVQRP